MRIKNLMSAKANPVMRRYREACERGDREVFRDILMMSEDIGDYRRLYRAYQREPGIFREVLETAHNSSVYTPRNYANFALNETGENSERKVNSLTAACFLAAASLPLGTLLTDAFLNSGSQLNDLRVGVANGLIAMGAITYFGILRPLSKARAMRDEYNFTRGKSIEVKRIKESRAFG